MEMTTLSSDSLCSKFGFMDGDVVTEMLWDADLDTDLCHHDLLIHLVRKHLLPLLPGIETRIINCIHNPIRVMEEQWDDCYSRDVSIDLTLPMILEAIQELQSDN